MTPFMEFVLRNNFQIANLLIKNRVDINAQNKKGNTALLICLNKLTTERYRYAQTHFTKTLKYLLKKNVNVNVRNNLSTTPLMQACYARNAFAVKKLIKLGANVNARDKYNYTPLFFTIVYRKYFKIASLLIKHGADINAKFRGGFGFGQTLLSRCIGQSNNFDKIKFLVSHGIDINAIDSKGMNALHYECSKPRANDNIVKYLIENGINFKQRDKFKNTALHYAIMYGRYGIA